MKIKYFLIILFFHLNFVKAQVESYEFIQTYTIADLEQVVADFGATGALVPEYEVDLYRVFYRTEYNDSLTLVTGALAIPRNMNCKPPLISYQHGTSSEKLGVPSYGSGELFICLVFAAEGNVLVAPDYIGLGGSIIDLHPYQHGFSQGHSAINLMRAARDLQSDLSFELNNQLFLFGYSQGGHATAATAKYIEELYPDEFNVTAAMPMSGAYDLSGSQADFVDNGQPYATPGYLPYIVMGYQSVYHDLYDSIQEVFISPYDSLMPYYLIGHNFDMSFINGQCDPFPLNMFTAQTIDAFYNDPNYPFKVRLEENDLLDWTPKTKIRMYYCTGDEQVYYRNSEVADSVWNYNGAPDAQAVFLTNEDHGGCIDDALIAARLFFGNLLNNGIEILINYDPAANSYTVDVLGEDIDNYDVLWSDGSTGTSVSNVQASIFYEVELTHKTTGCANDKRFNVESVTGLSTQTDQIVVNVYPNPSSQFIVLDINLTSNETVKIMDNQGKIVYAFDFQSGTEPMVNISALSAGVYYLHIGESVQHQGSFVKK